MAMVFAVPTVVVAAAVCAAFDLYVHRPIGRHRR
jgi:hypothetical protein